MGSIRHGCTNAARRQPHALLWSTSAALAILLTICLPIGALALGESRTLTFFHTHTSEQATITFRRGGAYDEEGLKQLNWILRDWRVSEPARMDPRVFDIVWELYQAVASRAPIHVISAYRSPTTNEMLRQSSSGVAENSQHMSGKAIDIRLPDVDPARVREAAMRLQYGGVGFYPASNFVHVDTGSVRAWPRMSQEQLARLFPDGKTLHLPASGKPLAGYEEARAEILPRNTALASQASTGTGGSLTSALATLFGTRQAGTSAPAAPLPSQATAFAPVQATASLASADAVPLPPRRPPLPPSEGGAEVARVEPRIEQSTSWVGLANGGDEGSVSRLLFSHVPFDVAARHKPQIKLAQARIAPVPNDAVFFRVEPAMATVALHASDHPEASRFAGPAVKRLPAAQVAGAGS